MKKLPRFEKDRILEMLGLQARSSTASMVLGNVGLIGLGVLAGLGLGLLMAPQSGRALRSDLRQRLKAGADRASGRARELLEATEMAGA